MLSPVSIDGSPKNAPEPVSDKISISKTLYTKKGSKIIGQLNQGDEVVVVIEFNAPDNINRSIVIADLLPAGFEIETILNAHDGQRHIRRRSRRGKKATSSGPYGWAGTLIKPQLAEKRDDRFVASMTISGSYNRNRSAQPDKFVQKNYKAAYVMRAITPGDYTLPGAVIEDMYRPEDYSTG